VSRAKLVVMLPALNEEGTIGEVIDGIPFKALREKGYDAIAVVVDGNSTDRTLEIARERGAKIIVQKGKGKGLGVRQAFALCHAPTVTPDLMDQKEEACHAIEGLTAMLDAKYLVMLDADGTLVPQSTSLKWSRR